MELNVAIRIASNYVKCMNTNRDKCQYLCRDCGLYEEDANKVIEALENVLGLAKIGLYKQPETDKEPASDDCKYYLPCGLCEKGIYRVCILKRKEVKENANNNTSGIS